MRPPGSFLPAALRWTIGLLIALQAVALPEPPGREIPPSMSADAVWVVRAYFEAGDIGSIATAAAELDVWTRKSDYLVVAVNRSGYKRLLDLGFLVARDPSRSIESFRLLDPAPATAKGGIPGYGCYRRVEEVRRSLRTIRDAHPQLAAIHRIGESWTQTQGQGGFDLEVLRLTNEALPGPKPVLLISAAVHGREYATAELATRFAERLVQGFGEDPDLSWILDHREIHLLLVANPDGRRQAEQGFLWRKNVNANYCAQDGVLRGADLNRNFSFGWASHGGSSADQCDETFRGATPFSEPESTALSAYMRELFGDHRPNDLTSAAPDSLSGLYLDIHSFGEQILWPWGFPGVPVPNQLELGRLARKLAWFNGYDPQLISAALYPTDGTTNEYVYGDLGIAALTFEIGAEFFEPCPNFEAIVAENIPALVYAAKVADLPYQTPDGPDVTQLLALPNAAVIGESVTLRLIADDARRSRRGAIDPIQDVDQFEIVFEVVDAGGEVVLPERRTAVADAGQATLTVATDDLTLGRYRVNSRARDASGTWGAWSSAWLDVVDAASTALIVGTTRDATSNKPVSVLVEAGQSEAQSDALSGRYAVRIPVGQANELEFSAAAYSSTRTDLPELTAGDVVERNVQLAPYCVLFEEDAEDGLDGWSTSGGWATTDEDAFRGARSITDSPGRNYEPNSRALLKTPVLDFSEFESISLSFHYRCDLEDQLDFAHISALRGTITGVVFTCTGNTGDWQRAQIPLEQLAGFGRNSLEFRILSDAAQQADGIYIDDLAIIGEGRPCPFPPESSVAISGELSGVWFDPDRPGEGFVFEVGHVGGRPVLIVTWYTFADGAPIWMIGSTDLAFDQASVTISMVSTRGAEFGQAFDPADVETAPWGELDLSFDSRELARISYRRRDGASGSYEATRVAGGLAANDRNDVPRILDGELSGTWYEPDAPGHGLTFEMARTDAGRATIATWYTYLEGQPVWLIGSASHDSNASSVSIPMRSFSGTGFGDAFNSGEIQMTEWGDIELSFPDCQTALLRYDFAVGQGQIELARLTGGLLDVSCVAQ